MVDKSPAFEVDQQTYEVDPVFQNSFRETIVIVILFVIFLGWSVGVSFWMGLERTDPPGGSAQVSLVWGMPSWVFWGVCLPWIAANLASAWFCFRLMTNDRLEEPEPPNPEDSGNDRATAGQQEGDRT